jgi:hypothetical protein
VKGPNRFDHAYRQRSLRPQGGMPETRRGQGWRSVGALASH